MAAPEEALANNNPSLASNIGLQRGVQLWSLKNDLAKDFDSTLEKLALMGYRYVESADYDFDNHTIHGYSPEVFKKKLEDQGLDLIAAHALFTLQQTERVLEDFGAAGVQYLVWPKLPEAPLRQPDFYEVAEVLNLIGQKTLEKGIRFGYHNHNLEFLAAPGLALPYDILLTHTDPRWVFFEMDLGWVIQAGVAPAKFFHQYPGRFPLWHIRDVDAGGHPCAVGAGRIDFKLIFNLQPLAGYSYGFVETPSSAIDGLKKIAESYHYLESKGLY